MKLYRIDETKTVETSDAYTSGRGAIPGGALVLIEPCEHGKYDEHWPKRKCHCSTNNDGEKGVWYTAWIDDPVDRTWVACWHEPWCVGAGLGESRGDTE